MQRLSILTAFLNEAGNLPLFRQRVEAVLGALGIDYEVVLIDDHSQDGSADIARAWAREDPHVQYLRLSRNCGSHAAYSAGLARCTGHCAVLLAADLQDPPEAIPVLLERWRAGHDVVWAARSAREGESRTTRLLARLGLTVMELLVPAMLLVRVSVAETVWLPAVLRVTALVKVWVPLSAARKV